MKFELWYDEKDNSYSLLQPDNQNYELLINKSKKLLDIESLNFEDAKKQRDNFLNW